MGHILWPPVTHDPVPDHGMSRSRLLTNHDEFTTIAFSSLQWCEIWNSGMHIFIGARIQKSSKSFVMYVVVQCCGGRLAVIPAASAACVCQMVPVYFRRWSVLVDYCVSVHQLTTIDRDSVVSRTLIYRLTITPVMLVINGHSIRVGKE